MVIVEIGTLRNAQVVHDPIKSLCSALGIQGAIRLLREFSDGFSETRVFLGELRSGPDDPQPFRLVFKIGSGRMLRDEAFRYLLLVPHARANAAFARIRDAKRMLDTLPTDDTMAAIAYEYAGDALGAADCIPFKSVFRACIAGERPIEEAEAIIDALARVLGSLYAAPTRCFAHEIAQYYLEHWAPDYQLAVDYLEQTNNRQLLTLHRLNPDHFSHERPTVAAILRQTAESPSTGNHPEIVLAACSIAEVSSERLVAWATSADDLSLHADLRELAHASRGMLTKGSTIALWAPAKMSRYETYLRRVQSALPSLEVSTPTIQVGPMLLHNPLMHLSKPLLQATKPPASTWSVPGHGDLHPGNVLTVGTVPVIIDYGKSETAIPVGVDAARLFGGLVRDVLADMMSLHELALVVGESLGLGTFVEKTNSPGRRAVDLLRRLAETLVPANAPDAKALWPVHLYGYAWLGLKWPNSPLECYSASYVLTALALQRILGAPPATGLGPSGKDTDKKSEPPANSASSIKPERPAEILILVSRFAGSADYDPTARIYSNLSDQILEVLPNLARVEQSQEVISSRKEAIELADRYRASMVVWGTYDNFGISPRYEVTRDSQVVKRSMIQLDQATRHQLSDRFEPYITQNLAAEISFLSLVAVGDICSLNLNHEVALKVYDRALHLIPDQSRAQALGASHIYKSMAAVYFALRRDTDALAANDRARTLSPGDLGLELQRLMLMSKIEKKSALQQFSDLRSLIRTRMEIKKEDQDEQEALQKIFLTLESVRTWADLRRFIESEQRKKDPAIQQHTTNKQFNKDVTNHLRQALEFHLQVKYSRALASVKAALRLNPNCAEAFVIRARILAVTDHVEEALKELAKAERLNPRLDMIYTTRGAIFCDSKEDYAGAVQQYDKAFDLGADKIQVLEHWGRSMIALGRSDEILQYLRDTDIDPSDSDIYAVRAYFYKSRKEFDSSLIEINQAIELAPQQERAAILRERADIYSAMGRYRQAINDIEQGLAVANAGTFTENTLRQRLQTLHEQIIVTDRVLSTELH